MRYTCVPGIVQEIPGKLPPRDLQSSRPSLSKQARVQEGRVNGAERDAPRERWRKGSESDLEKFEFEGSDAEADMTRKRVAVSCSLRAPTP